MTKTAEENRFLQAGFTKDQADSVRGLLEFIAGKWSDINCIKTFVGAAGTGKTYCVNYLVHNCGVPLSKVGLAAPTHKACRILRETVGISASTLHSDLGLRLNLDKYDFNPDKPPYDSKGRIKIEDYDVYILDEASMVNKSLKALLESQAKKHRCKIIYLGDSSQLTPVGEATSPCLNGRTGFKLNKIVRQGTDNPISILLALLRNDISKRTFTFVEHIIRNPSKYNNEFTKGYEVLRYAEFIKQINVAFSNKDYERDINMYKVIAFTNDAVNMWNKYIRGLIIPNSDKACITKNDLITSYVTLVDDFQAKIIQNCDDYVVKDLANYVHPTYGIVGYMVTFICVYDGSVTTPLFVVDHYNAKSVSKYVEIYTRLINDAKNAKSMKASLWKKYYNFKREVLLLTNIKNSNTGEVIATRDIDYGFAITSHRAQGSTYENVYVDVNDMLYDKQGKPYTNIDDINRRLYVACGRTKNKLFISYGK